MSAADNNSPHQFKLFMTGTEWKQQVTHSNDGPLDTIWKEKEARARAPYKGGGGQYFGEVSPDRPNQISGGMYDKMKKDGYVRGLSSDAPRIVLEDSYDGKGGIRHVQSEGHHRVAAAAAVESDSRVGKAAASMLGGPPEKNPVKDIFLPTNYIDTTA